MQMPDVTLQRYDDGEFVIMYGEKQVSPVLNNLEVKEVRRKIEDGTLSLSDLPFDIAGVAELVYAGDLRSPGNS